MSYTVTLFVDYFMKVIIETKQTYNYFLTCNIALVELFVLFPII